MTPQEMVTQFHQTFGLPIRSEPSVDVPEWLLRMDLIEEEHGEFRDAMMDMDVVETADALADLVYVAYGAALTFGIDLDRVVSEVHRSNMTKVGPDGVIKRREDGKVLKPLSFEQPRIAEVLGL